VVNQTPSQAPAWDETTARLRLAAPQRAIATSNHSVSDASQKRSLTPIDLTPPISPQTKEYLRQISNPSLRRYVLINYPGLSTPTPAPGDPYLLIYASIKSTPATPTSRRIIDVSTKAPSRPPGRLTSCSQLASHSNTPRLGAQLTPITSEKKQSPPAARDTEPEDTNPQFC